MLGMVCALSQLIIFFYISRNVEYFMKHLPLALQIGPIRPLFTCAFLLSLFSICGFTSSLSYQSDNELVVSYVTPVSADHKVELVFLKPTQKQIPISLFNAHGMEVHHQSLAKGVPSLKLDLSEFPEGMYLVMMGKEEEAVSQSVYNPGN